MSKLKFVPPILAELCLPREFERQPEPDLIMDRVDQVEAYLEAGDNEGGMFALHLFHAAHITQTIYGARRVIDLACGPATQLLLLARFNPDTNFIGVDLSTPMLEVAERACKAQGLMNVAFMQHDVTDLDSLNLGKFDGVTSTMAAHHLPTVGHLERFFAQIRALSEESAGIYIADLLRPRRRHTVDFLVNASSDVQPETFNNDYKNSMLAAFLGTDFRRLQSEYLASTRYHTTLPLRLFMIMKSASRPILEPLRKAFVEQRSSLPARLRQDLDDLRFFFALGGLRPDPFA